MKFLEFFHTQQTKTSTIQNKISGLINKEIGNFDNITPELSKEVCGICSPILSKIWNNYIIVLNLTKKSMYNH